jgi:carboxymethylenebutenolidase
MVNQKIIDVFDAYTKKEMDRRQFLEKLAIITGSIAAAYSVLPLLENNYAQAQIVPADDSRLTTQTIKYQAEGGEMTAYLASPKTDGKLPAVLVVHENKGLNPHIEDVTRRVALEGYLAMAPDALSAAGGSPADPDKAVELIKQLDMNNTIRNFVAAAAYLKTHPQSTGKVGVVGFCWGGAMANQLAVHSADILAAVPYYGMQPTTEDAGRIKASLLLHYAGIDERINKGIPAYTQALDAHQVPYTMYMYEGANHAFNNDTNAARYDKQAAELAWKRTIDFFNAKLKG